MSDSKKSTDAVCIRTGVVFGMIRNCYFFFKNRKRPK